MIFLLIFASISLNTLLIALTLTLTRIILEQVIHINNKLLVPLPGSLGLPATCILTPTPLLFLLTLMVELWHIDLD